MTMVEAVGLIAASDCCHPKHMLQLHDVLKLAMWRCLDLRVLLVSFSSTPVNGTSIYFSTIRVKALIGLSILNACPARYSGCSWPFCRWDLTCCLVQVIQEISFSISVLQREGVKHWATQSWWGDCRVCPWWHVGVMALSPFWRETYTPVISSF